MKESEEERDVIGWTNVEENSMKIERIDRGAGRREPVIVISKFKPPPGLECNLDHEVDIQQLSKFRRNNAINRVPACKLAERARTKPAGASRRAQGRGY